MQDTEVLIVGAGPVGLSLALECVRHGVGFRIVDASAKASETSKALAIWSAAQEAFCAMGVVDQLREEGLRPDGLRICTGGRTLMRVPVAAFTDSLFPEPILLPQSSTERILAAKLGEHGRVVERAWELCGMEEQVEGVRARLRSAEGAEQEIACEYLVGCDGAHSAVRHLSGAKFEGKALPETFILCDAEVSGVTLPQEVLLYVSKRGMMPMFPIHDRVWRVVSSRSPADGTATPTLQEMQEHVNERGPVGLTLSNPEWLSCFRISERKVDRFRRGRVLLAGDAAHIHSPAGGQGMNTGVQDAFNLGWKLACILRHGCEAEPLLESYHAERSPVAGKVIAEAAMRTRMAMLARGPLAMLRNLGASLAGRSGKVVRGMAKSFSGIGIRYGAGALVGDDKHWNEDFRAHGYVPGLRMRDGTVYEEERPVSLLRQVMASTKFTLVVFSGRKPNYRDAETVAALRQKAAGYSSLVGSIAVWRGEHAPDDSWVLDPGGEVHRRFGAETCAAYLVRPDAVVAIRTQPADFGPVAEMISRLQRQP